MLLLALENTEDLKEIQLIYKGLEPVTVLLPDKPVPLYIDKSGNPIPNSVPVTIVVPNNRLDDIIWQPTDKILSELKQNAIKITANCKKQRKPIIPYAIACEVVDNKFKSLGRANKKRLIDRLRKEVLKNV